jgi:hypothetical protein
MVARYYGAEYSIVAESGRGCYQNSDGTTSGVVPSLYQKSMNTSTTNDWNFSSWVPQVVCIFLYFNDWNWSAHPTQNQFEPAYKNLVTTIRSKYADADICCLFAEQHDAYTYANAGTYIHNVVNQLNSSGDSKVHYIGMQFVIGSDLGADWHPNVAGHQKVANDLIPRLAGYMGSTGTISLKGQRAINSRNLRLNSFANSTRISFNSDNPGIAQVKIFNVEGKLIFKRTITVTKGNNVLDWNTDNLCKGRVVRGLYVYQLDVQADAGIR